MLEFNDHACDVGTMRSSKVCYVPFVKILLEFFGPREIQGVAEKSL